MKIPLSEYRALLARYLKPQWPRVLLLAVLLFSSIGLQLANPLVLRAFLDAAQAGTPVPALARLAVLFLGLALVQQAVSVAATYFSEVVGWTATNALRADLVRHCLHLDLSFHSARTPGEMIERVDGDVAALTNFFSQFLIQVLGNALLLVGILALLFAVDWRLGLALSLFSGATLFILARFSNVAVPHWKAERQASADLFGFLEERLAGTEDIRANGAEGYVLRRFYGLMRELLRRSLKAALMINVLINASMFLFALGTATAFALGAWLFNQELLTLGTVYVVFYYTNLLERPIRTITRQMETLQRAGAGLARVQELLRTQARLDDSGAERLPSGALALELSGVSFGYHDAQPVPAAGTSAEAADLPDDTPPIPERVLHDLSFRLAPGRVLGLLGRTGSGKTTLTRLLLRLYDPDAGELALGDGVHQTTLRRVPLEHLRQRVGMVTQNIQLFHASVRDNLTFFDESIPDDRIARTLRDLGLEGWLRSMPRGLDTELESGGGGLSAGQAQLLAFARIFLRDPGLVILDEASSRLDPASESLIERAVDRLVEGRTAIIVAHRLHTVQRADDILILEDGRIAEMGPRAALAGDPDSRFCRLLQTGLEEVLA